jgi:hypothetical protein
VVIESRWVWQPLALAGETQPRRLNNYPPRHPAQRIFLHPAPPNPPVAWAVGAHGAVARASVRRASVDSLHSDLHGILQRRHAHLKSLVPFRVEVVVHGLGGANCATTTPPHRVNQPTHPPTWRARGGETAVIIILIPRHQQAPTHSRELDPAVWVRGSCLPEPRCVRSPQAPRALHAQHHRPVEAGEPLQTRQKGIMG